jgi:hypothetical protein
MLRTTLHRARTHRHFAPSLPLRRPLEQPVRIPRVSSPFFPSCGELRFTASPSSPSFGHSLVHCSPWTMEPPVHRLVNLAHQLYHWKIIHFHANPRNFAPEPLASLKIHGSLVVAPLVSGGLGPSEWGRWIKTKGISLSMAYFTQGLLHVLAISNLQGSRGVALLLSMFVQCVANIIPGVVVLSVLPTSFLTLLFSALTLQFLVSAIWRIDEISKKGGGEESRRKSRWIKRFSTKILLYNPKDCACKIYLTFTLALKQRCKSSIWSPHKEQSILI